MKIKEFKEILAKLPEDNEIAIDYNEVTFNGGYQEIKRYYNNKEVNVSQFYTWGNLLAKKPTEEYIRELLLCKKCGEKPYIMLIEQEQFLNQVNILEENEKYYKVYCKCDNKYEDQDILDLVHSWNNDN